MTHILEDLTHKMVQVNPNKKEVSWDIKDTSISTFAQKQHIFSTLKKLRDIPCWKNIS